MSADSGEKLVFVSEERCWKGRRVRRPEVVFDFQLQGNYAVLTGIAFIFAAATAAVASDLEFARVLSEKKSFLAETEAQCQVLNPDQNGQGKNKDKR